jgi:hypothetical protein
MKGTSTATKLDMLEKYYDDQHAVLNASVFFDLHVHSEQWRNCDICIRIDNYIKALCRGGQLEPGMTFNHFNDGCIRNHIRK